MKQIIMTFESQEDYDNFLNMTLSAFEGKDENTVIDDGENIRIHIGDLNK